MGSEKISMGFWIFDELDSHQHADQRPFTQILDKFYVPLGIKFAEVWMPQYVDKSSAKEVKETLDSYDIQASNIFNDGGFVTFWNDSCNKRKMTLDCLDVAVEMGSQCKVVVQGGKYEQYGMARTRAIDNLMENLTGGKYSIVKAAEDRGVNLCFHPGVGLFTDADVFYETLKKINSPNVKAALCPGIIDARGKDSVYFLDRIQEYLDFVHLWDSISVLTESGAKRRSDIAIGTGRVNYEKIFKRLEEMKYDGFLCLEPHSRNYDEMPKIIEDSVQYIRTHFNWPD